jgi:hypothetical protein
VSDYHSSQKIETGLGPQEILFCNQPREFQAVYGDKTRADGYVPNTLISPMKSQSWKFTVTRTWEAMIAAGFIALIQWTA